jgi:sulfate permease, SulP family
VLVPKLANTPKTYSREQFVSDLTAGLIVGVVALPLAIAFAIASGVTPERGLYTAVIAGFIISALGGSRVQIGGPTGAFVVIVYGIVQKYGVDGLTVATIMAGLLLIAFGLARLGAAIKFIPFPVVTGFTSGIAAILIVQQLRDVLGLRLATASPEIVERLSLYVAQIGTINRYAVLLSMATLLILMLWPKVSHTVPSPFVALILTTVAAYLFHLPVETIGTRFGEIRAGFPSLSLPLIIRMRNVPAIDSTAMHALQDLIRRTRRDRTLVFLSDVHAQPLMALGRSGLLDEIGDEYFCGNVDDALAAARKHLGLPPEEATATQVPA